MWDSSSFCSFHGLQLRRRLVLILDLNHQLPLVDTIIQPNQRSFSCLEPSFNNRLTLLHLALSDPLRELLASLGPRSSVIRDDEALHPNAHRDNVRKVLWSLGL